MTHRVLGIWMFAAALALGPAPWAQESETREDEPAPSSEKPEAVPPAEDAGTPEVAPEHRLRADIEAWVPEPSGLDQLGATRLSDTGDPFGTSILTPGYGTKTEGRYRLDYRLPNDIGSIGFVYQKHADESELQESAPSSFIYGEIAVNPLLAGLFDGTSQAGLADGIDVDARSSLRDVSLVFRRELFASNRIKAQWHADWRRVKHTRSDSVGYYALAPVPPVPLTTDLRPNPDIAYIASSFDGRGPGTGLDIQIPLWQDKLHFEGGASVVIMRGDMDSDYQSVTWAYVLDLPDQFGIPDQILGAPFDEFNEFILLPGETVPVPLTDFIDQRALAIGVASGNQSASAQAWDGYLGLRWNALQNLELYAGFRAGRYEDVARELRPQVSSYLITDEGIQSWNLQTITETDRSLTLEGLYFGLTLRFW